MTDKSPDRESLKDEIADHIGSGMRCIDIEADIMLERIIASVEQYYKSRVIEAVEELIWTDRPNDNSHIIHNGIIKKVLEAINKVFEEEK